MNIWLMHAGFPPWPTRGNTSTSTTAGRTTRPKFGSTTTSSIPLANGTLPCTRTARSTALMWAGVTELRRPHSEDDCAQLRRLGTDWNRVGAAFQHVALLRVVVSRSVDMLGSELACRAFFLLAGTVSNTSSVTFLETTLPFPSPWCFPSVPLHKTTYVGTAVQIISTSIGGLVVKLAVAIRGLPTSDNSASPGFDSRPMHVFLTTIVYSSPS